MSRPGPAKLNRPAFLALAMLVWLALPTCARPARAAGCHVPDRPILGSENPDRGGDHIAAWAMMEQGGRVPPVLTRIPCSGETPHTSTVPSMAIGAACLEALATGAAQESGRALAFEGFEILDPHPARLDRPPR